LQNYNENIENDKIFAEGKRYWRQKNYYYHQSIADLIKSVIPKNSSVIEIGCGEGDTISRIDSSEITGIEKNQCLIESGKKKYAHIDYIKCDIELIHSIQSFVPENKKYDYIIVSDLIGTLNDIQKVFEKMQMISHEKTKIIVTYYNYFWNPILKLGEIFHLKMKEDVMNWLYIDEIKNLLLLSSFNVIKSSSLLLIPKNIPLVSSFFNKYIARLPVFKRLCLVGYVIATFEKLNNTNIKDYSTTVLIPCRNEEGNIEKIIPRIPELGSHTEIIFVEGNSTDNTHKKIEEVIKANPGKDIKLFKQEGKGKGDAVRKGFENASCDILMILDADMTVAPEDLTKFYNALKYHKGEFINGTRLVYQMKEKAMRRLNKFGNIFFSKMFSWLLGQRITDTLCGTKAFFKSDYEKIVLNRKYFGDFDPFGDFDLLFGAAKLNLKIIEIPIRYGERIYGDTNINRFRDGLRLLKMCFIAMRKIKFAK
jgi:ubiquinone/menaquinone biosynthesis C-methylase UbiE